MPISSPVTPDRSLKQRMEALQRANDIRVKRAELKKHIKNGQQSAPNILREPPDFVKTMRVIELLKAVPKIGSVKATRMLRDCAISAVKTVGGLSERQRQELIVVIDSR